MDVTGKTVIITGASRGIGKQVAIELGRLGANVVVAARTVEARRSIPGTIAETVEAVEAAGGRALAVRTDLNVDADLAALVQTTVEHFGGVDVLINNAADTSGGSVTDWERTNWERQLHANLLAPISLIQAVLPSMTERGGGVIINMTSGAGDLFPEGSEPTGSEALRLGKQFAYATSKAGMNRFGNIVAPELRPMNVALITLDPGFIRTELIEFMGERGVVDPDTAAPMAVPVRTILHLVTCDDPLAYSGRVLRAAAFNATLD